MCKLFRRNRWTGVIIDNDFDDDGVCDEVDYDDVLD